MERTRWCSNGDPLGRGPLLGLARERDAAQPVGQGLDAELRQVHRRPRRQDPRARGAVDRADEPVQDADGHVVAGARDEAGPRARCVGMVGDAVDAQARAARPPAAAGVEAEHAAQELQGRDGALGAARRRLAQEDGPVARAARPQPAGGRPVQGAVDAR
jgi:hypothetical protein